MRRNWKANLLTLVAGSFCCLATFAIDIQLAPKAASTVQPLSPLLRKKDGAPITTKEGWLKRREELKKDWFKALGCQVPDKRAPLKTEILETETLPDFTRQYLRYQIEEGVFTDGYLLTPKSQNGKLPAIVVFHPTTPLQAKGVAGLASEYAEEKQQGLQLVRRGYIVWCPRNYIFDAVKGVKDGIPQYTANAERVRIRHRTWTGMGRMVFDSIRAADFLVSLPNVDTNNIGGIGHSLGGKQVFYAAAFDSRYKAVVSSEGGIGLGFSNWEAPWYLGPQIKEPGWQLENHQVLSFIAPRAFLLLAGDSADGDKSWSFISAAKPVYELFGAANNLGWYNHHQGHRYSPEAREVAEQFLDHHLKN